MKSIKLTMLAGAALSVLSVSAWADDLADLKAQIELLNDRIAKMEAAPQVPTGYSLLTISEGAQPVIPGMPLTSRERAAYGETATIISVLPTADAPATTTITWSGYARAGLIYNDYSEDLKLIIGYGIRTIRSTPTGRGSGRQAPTTMTSTSKHVASYG